MVPITLIAAVDQNWGIGFQGSLLARIPADLKRFQALTMGRAVILGRKTLETFPGGRPLPGRQNYVLSSNPAFTVDSAIVCRSLDELLSAAPEDAFVIGGESVYRALLPRCTLALSTKIGASFPADTFFPNLDQDPAWTQTETEGPFPHEGLSFQYATYQRVV